MNRGRVAVVTAFALLVAGCALARPVIRPSAWDRYGDAGPLPVYSADFDEAGPTLYRALRRDARLRDTLALYREPDELEIVGGRYAPKRIILTYRRRGAGKPRRIVLEPVGDGYVARAPQPLREARDRSRGARARDRRPATDAGSTVDPAPCPGCLYVETPTAMQRLECPIDPTRTDCRTFCGSGVTYEWCN